MKTPTTEFKLTVTKFRDIIETTASQRGTSFTMAVTKDESDFVRVTRFATGPHRGTVKRIRINPGRVALRFLLAQPAGSDVGYSPVGIAFRRKAPTPTTTPAENARIVRKVFPPHTMVLDETGHTIAITANFPAGSTPDEGQYKFFLIIQRETDGKLGIIDPPLDHDHTDLT